MAASHIIRVFSSQSVTSTNTITSDSLDTARAFIVGLDYRLNTATTATHVNTTIRIRTAPDPSMPFLLPVDSAKAVKSLLITADSNDQYIRLTDIPYAPWTQVQLVGATANTVTFDSIHLILDEAGAS